MYYEECKNHKDRKKFDAYYTIVVGPIMDGLLPATPDSSLGEIATDQYWQTIYQFRKGQFIGLKNKMGINKFCDCFIQVRFYGRMACYQNEVE